MKVCVHAALLALIASQASAASMQFDFGRTNLQSPFNPGTDGWNNIVPATTDLFAIFDENGAIVPGVSLSITDTFFQTGEPSSLGSESPSGDAAGYPVSATDDYFFGHSTAFAGADPNPYGEVTLRGLDPSQVYDFTFFSARNGIGDNRDTEFIVTGANSGSGVASTGNNDTEVVKILGIAPDGNNEISVGVQAGPDNNNTIGFFYINLMDVSVGIPEPTTGVLLAMGGLLVAAAPKNVLFYGNSFTLGFGSTTSVNALFEDIAIAAGHDAPLVQSAAASGQDIEWHLNNNTAAIFTLIPPDRDWDAVVMQEHSTKLTRAYTGNPRFPDSVDESKSTVVDLYNTVQLRSPNAVPVLYETWARGPGHTFYTPPNVIFTDPAEMQAEVRDGYDALKEAIDTEEGAPTALIAPVGDAWEEANYDNLHANDNWHAGNRGTLLAALVIYGTVYGDTTTSDIPLDAILTSVNLGPDDGAFLTAAADAVLNPIPEPSCVLLAAMAIVSQAARRRR
ncbi:unnamed protein product [Cladocopium goreaui]|uniref:PEP-CTERM protein-sorting domain-containing protein n=1 Tax=Cladocopium goreaui TaxID=2562237 RepID=A0A9P1G4Q5_9DINO|nr:unnamed protein product [Cladocopium goreaui]